MKTLFLLISIFLSSCASVSESYDEFTGERTARTSRNWVLENIFTNERLSLDLVQKELNEKKTLFFYVGYGAPSYGSHLNINDGESLIFIASGKKFPFKLVKNSSNATNSSYKAVGKFETAKYTVEELKTLRSIIFSKAVKYKIYGKSRNITGTLEEEDLDIFKEFYSKYLKVD